MRGLFKRNDENIADLEALALRDNEGRGRRYIGLLITALAFLVGFLAPI